MRHYFSGEHPVTAVVALVAIVAVIVLIAWARYELYDAEAQSGHREVEAAATANRFATGFSP